MIKKFAMGTVALATVSTLAFGTDVFSYTRAGFQSARDRIRSEVPIDFEIERARKEVEQLLPEVRKSVHLIAEEQVEVAQLENSVTKREAALADQQGVILDLTADLKSGTCKFRYAGHTYSQREVEKDLAERFNRFKLVDDALKQDRQLLAAKQQSLAANRETLEGMLSQKKTLEAEVARLQARVRTLAARKQINGLEIDDSQLNRVKTLIATIEKRLDVEDAVLASAGDLNGLIPVESKSEEPAANITAQVDEFFGSRTDDARMVTQ